MKKINIADEVLLHWRQGDGINANPHPYESSAGKINTGYLTTFQEYAVVSENRLTKLDNHEEIESIIPLIGCVTSPP